MLRDAWQQVVHALEREEFEFVFGLPGNARHLYDALYDSERLRTVLVRDESSGAYMAMAYARVTGKVGCCFGCPGPGVAKLVPGILEAYSGCTPLLALSVRAPQKTEGMGAFQETDHLSMMRPITKWAVTVERADRVGWTIRRAIAIATTGKPGPVYVEIPADVATVPIDQPAYTPADTGIRPGPDPARIERLVDLIEHAQRPVVVCGGGAVTSGAYGEVRRIADDLGIPVLATPAGRGILEEDHPLFCGSVGLYRTEFPKSVYQSADLLITVGSRMEEFQSANWTYFPDGARFAQIDIDPSEIGRNWIPDVAVVSDATLALRSLLDVAGLRNIAPDPQRVEHLRRERVEAIHRMLADVQDDSLPIKAKRVVRAINDVFGRNTIAVLENGASDLWMYYWPYYQVLDRGALVPPAEQTVMGLGVCGAIAVKLARPDWQVVSVTGDGAFNMALHELPTAVDERAPVTWVVLNDQSLGWPNWSQRTKLRGREIATRFGQPFDFVAVAQAAGCHAQRVVQPGEIVPALERAREQNARGMPAVIDITIDPDDHHVGFDEFHEVR